jgi:hypothetical protein
MGNANIHSASNRLEHATKDLLDKWADAREVWRDAVAREFEQMQILPLETASQAAVNGMQELAEVLARIQADCADRDQAY